MRPPPAVLDPSIVVAFAAAVSLGGAAARRSGTTRPRLFQRPTADLCLSCGRCWAMSMPSTASTTCSCTAGSPFSRPPSSGPARQALWLSVAQQPE